MIYSHILIRVGLKIVHNRLNVFFHTPFTIIIVPHPAEKCQLFLQPNSGIVIGIYDGWLLVVGCWLLAKQEVKVEDQCYVGFRYVDLGSVPAGMRRCLGSVKRYCIPLNPTYENS